MPYLGLTPAEAATPGTVNTTLTILYDDGTANRTANVTLSVTVAGNALPAGGDGDLTRNTRLHWLNSDVGREGPLPAPYTALSTVATTRTVYGAFVTLQVSWIGSVLGKEHSVSLADNIAVFNQRTPAFKPCPIPISAFPM